jgi:hypothetical protein
MLTPLSRALYQFTPRTYTIMTTPLRATALQLSSLSSYSTCEVRPPLALLLQLPADNEGRSQTHY